MHFFKKSFIKFFSKLLTSTKFLEFDLSFLACKVGCSNGHYQIKDMSELLPIHQGLSNRRFAWVGQCFWYTAKMKGYVPIKGADKTLVRVGIRSSQGFLRLFLGPSFADSSLHNRNIIVRASTGAEKLVRLVENRSEDPNFQVWRGFYLSCNRTKTRITFGTLQMSN